MVLPFLSPKNSAAIAQHLMINPVLAAAISGSPENP
jgi:hypothetical protein